MSDRRAAGERQASGRQLVFVARAADAPPPERGRRVVVLDTAWTRAPDDRPDLLPVRPAVSAVLRRADLFERALTLLDGWAEASSIAERMTRDGVSWWFRRRFWSWLWLHERLLWHGVVHELLVGEAAAQLPEQVAVPWDEGGLIDVLRLRAESGGFSVDAVGGPPKETSQVQPDPPELSGPTGSSGPPGPLDRLRWLMGGPSRRWRRRELARRRAVLDARLGAASAPGRRAVVVLTNPATHQVVRTAAGDRRVDPFLASVVERLAGEGFQPITLAFGLDRRDDRDWRAVTTDGTLVPESILDERFADPADKAAAADAAAEVERALADGAPPEASCPLDAGGIDLGPLLLAELRRFATGGSLARLLRDAIRAERLMRAMRDGEPSIVLRRVPQGVLVDPMTLEPGEEEAVARRLADELARL